MPTATKPDDISHDCTEMFYLDADGNKSDARLYAEALDNPEADAKWQKRAKANQIAQGMSQEDADLIFGSD